MAGPAEVSQSWQVGRSVRGASRLAGQYCSLRLKAAGFARRLALAGARARQCLRHFCRQARLVDIGSPLPRTLSRESHWGARAPASGTPTHRSLSRAGGSTSGAGGRNPSEPGQWLALRGCVPPRARRSGGSSATPGSRSASARSSRRDSRHVASESWNWSSWQVPFIVRGVRRVERCLRRGAHPAAFR